MHRDYSIDICCLAKSLLTIAKLRITEVSSIASRVRSVSFYGIVKFDISLSSNVYTKVLRLLQLKFHAHTCEPSCCLVYRTADEYAAAITADSIKSKLTDAVYETLFSVEREVKQFS